MLLGDCQLECRLAVSQFSENLMSMDPEHPDHELVVDYATGKRFLRFHLDIELAPEQFASVQNPMEAWDKSGTKEYLKKHLAPATHPFIDLFIKGN